MRTSTNYNLKLPEGTDNVRRKDFVENFEKIDLELKNNDTQVKDIANDSYPIVEATGTNTYVGSTARITSLAKGTKFTLFVGNNASGNCTVNLNNYGAKNIKDSFGNIVNNLKANIPYNLCYNGSDFILQGKGGGGNATPSQVLLNSTFTNDSGPQVGSMPNRGAPVVNLNCGGTFNLQEGYYSGGQAIVNSLASQTPATATAAQILSGFSAWVNGNKVNGNASIQSLGGIKFRSGTIDITDRNTRVDYGIIDLENNTLESWTISFQEIHLPLDFVAKFVIIYSGSLTRSISVKFNDICTVIYDENDNKYDKVSHCRVDQNSNTIPINLSSYAKTFTYYAFGY
ncbi:hypothetical protein [Clostridium sp. VAP41]|uniref:hypothetical protein n=1 Tax=Clostridium sp. VAP41 TaxID=2949979 RepID=UPI00207A0CE4|nr:hypothetical protein [Clostridium sp. VAP41]